VIASQSLFLEGGYILGQIPRPVAELSGLLIFVVALACEVEALIPTPALLPNVLSILEWSGGAMALLESFRFDMGHRNEGMPIIELVMANTTRHTAINYLCAEYRNAPDAKSPKQKILARITPPTGEHLGNRIPNNS